MLNLFWEKIVRHGCLGVDWGGETIKWIRLVPAGPRQYALAFAEVLPQPKNEPDLAATLKDFIKDHGLGGMPVAVSFQDESLHVRRMEFPRMPDDDLKEAIRWELRDIAEGSMELYDVRYSVLEEIQKPESVRWVLLAYAVKQAALERQTQLLLKAGLKPFFLEPTPVSLAYAVERTYHVADQEWVGCVDIGQKESFFITLMGGKLYFVRPLSGISQEEAAGLKAGFPTKLALELERALDAFSLAHHVEKIEKIVLAGGGAHDNDLPASLSKNLGVPTEILNPFRGIQEVHSFPSAVQTPYLFGPALGMAFLKP